MIRPSAPRHVVGYTFGAMLAVAVPILGVTIILITFIASRCLSRKLRSIDSGMRAKISEADRQREIRAYLSIGS